MSRSSKRATSIDQFQIFRRYIFFLCKLAVIKFGVCAVFGKEHWRNEGKVLEKLIGSMMSWEAVPETILPFATPSIVKTFFFTNEQIYNIMMHKEESGTYSTCV